MANNPYVNKVQTADGTTIIDISDTTALSTDVLFGKCLYAATGEKIAGSALNGLEYETGMYTPEEDISKPFITFARFHYLHPAYILLSDTMETVPSENSTTVFAFFDFYMSFGSTLVVPDSDPIYAMAFRIYEAATAPNGSWYRITSLSGSSATSMPYWVTPSGFYPFGGSSSRYFRTGRTYKWVAVWAHRDTAYNLFEGLFTYSNKTNNGVTFTWNGDVCTLTGGTSSSASAANHILAISPISDCFVPGATYPFSMDVSTPNENAPRPEIRITWYPSLTTTTGYNSVWLNRNTTSFTIPADAKRWRISVYLSASRTIENVTTIGNIRCLIPPTNVIAES